MKHKLKNASCFSFFTLLSIVVMGQADIANLKNVIPPSPNASALGKYAEWPVNLYTGVPNISVPLYELKGRTISVPVSLSYHAAGNKVGEIASWVGLGWSLQAGGVITRSVHGLPDELGYFSYATAYSNPDDRWSSSVSTSTYIPYQVGVAKNLYDGQQDIYSFSALGRSYRFMLKANGTVQTIPYSNIKVVSNPIVGSSSATSAATWTVLLEDGTKLLFGGSGCTETTSNPRVTTGDGAGIDFISSWYLKSITSTSKETINFTYSSSTITQDSYFSQSDYIQVKTGSNDFEGSSAFAEIVNSTAATSSAEMQTISALSVSTIESDLGRMDFVVDTGRLDVKGGKKLSEIKIFAKQAGKYIEDYKFQTSYSTAQSGNELSIGTLDTSYFHYRLRLNEIIKATASDTTQKWVFEYNSLNLPSRRSFAQDHWGFFNGATSNTTLLPYHYLTEDDGTLRYLYGQLADAMGFMPQNNHELGASRAPAANYMQAEILTTIHYPTGGYSQFIYEPNSYKTSEEQFVATGIEFEKLISVDNHNTDSIGATSTFRLTKPGNVSLHLEYSIGPNIDQVSPTVTAKIIYPDNTKYDQVNISESDISYRLTDTGTYTFQVISNISSTAFGPDASTSFVNYDASLSYMRSTGIDSINKITGGLRIKIIKSNDGINATTINARYFTYDSILIINPVDTVSDYVTTQSVEHYVSGTGEHAIFDKITRNSSTKFAFGSVQGGTTGYGTVTTSYGAGRQNGKTVTTFSSEPDDQSVNTKDFPYPEADSRDHRRGLVLNQKEYSAGQVLLKELNNTYAFVVKGSITGFKAGYNDILDASLCTDAYGNCGIYVQPCFTTSEQVNHTTSSETLYDSTGSITTLTNYFYDDSLNTQPVRITMIDSKGDTIKNINRYAFEKSAINTASPLSSSASAAIDTLLLRNIVNISLQQEKYHNSTLISRTLLGYRNWDANIVMPDTIKLQKGSNALEARVVFNKYDSYGNILEQAKQNDLSHSYVYDYVHTYPVAEAVNASFSDIAYTSFESDGSGSWSFDTTGKGAGNGAVTGKNAYTLSTGSVQRTSLSSGAKYVITYWLKNSSGSASVNSGSGGTALVTKNGWTLYQLEITGTTTVTLSGSGVIDELRLYPKYAQMTTYCYDPLIGITHKCDVNNLVTFFEYDSFNRLLRVRDADKNIIKSYNYTYGEAQ